MEVHLGQKYYHEILNCVFFPSFEWVRMTRGQNQIMHTWDDKPWNSLKAEERTNPNSPAMRQRRTDEGSSGGLRLPGVPSPGMGEAKGSVPATLKTEQMRRK